MCIDTGHVGIAPFAFYVICFIKTFPVIFQWSELNTTKPDDDYEDPADISAIKEAKENMGDYKLKSASDYVVPDHMRMNAEKARARLIVLKELVGIVDCGKWVFWIVDILDIVDNG